MHFPILTTVVDILRIEKAAGIDRQTLAISGLQPQQHGADDLESMGM